MIPHWKNGLRLVTALPVAALMSCGGHDKSTTAQAPAPSATPASVAQAAPVPPPDPASNLPAAALPQPGRENSHTTGINSGRTIARVNGKPIYAEKVLSVYEMNKDMLQQRGRTLNATEDQALKSQSLEAVVADELFYQAALAKGFTASPTDVDTALSQFKVRAGSEENYRKFVADSGLTDTEVRAEVARNLQTEAYRKSLFAGRSVTDDEAKKYYDTNAPKGMFKAPEQVHVQYILVKVAEKDPESVRLDARTRAEEAAKRASAGEDFAALAKQYSQDATAARGGDIGFFPRGVMFPKFEEVAFSAKPGDVSSVFETPKGFNVMKVLEKKPETNRSYDEVKTQLKLEMGRLMQEDAVRSKIRELATAAKIELLDDSFAPPRPVASAKTGAPAGAAKP